MYFLIARWGGGDRERSALRFIVYTLLGSVIMLLGLLLIGVKAGTFDMVTLATDNGSHLSHTTQLTAALAIGIGLAVKAPMWPLHSWLPDAHTAAPTVGSVLLAGVLLKMGTYGLVRIVLPMAPEGMRTFAPYLAAFAVVGILYGSLACLALARQGNGGDLKRLIAYSSVGHMGFVLLGIASLTPTGVNGALFANIAHGLITGLLFFLVGAVKDRYGTSDLDRLAGRTGAALYGRAPRLGGLLAFGAVASLGLPGLAGFWGEMLAMFGAFKPGDGLSRPAYLTFTALAAFGTLLTAAYLLTVVRRVCMGDRDSAHAEPVLADVRGYEFAAWTPLAALTVLAGLWPAVLARPVRPGRTHPARRQLMTVPPRAVRRLGGARPGRRFPPAWPSSSWSPTSSCRPAASRCSVWVTVAGLAGALASLVPLRAGHHATFCLTGARGGCSYAADHFTLVVQVLVLGGALLTALLSAHTTPPPDAPRSRA